MCLGKYAPAQYVFTKPQITLTSVEQYAGLTVNHTLCSESNLQGRKVKLDQRTSLISSRFLPVWTIGSWQSASLYRQFIHIKTRSHNIRYSELQERRGQQAVYQSAPVGVSVHVDYISNCLSVPSPLLFHVPTVALIAAVRQWGGVVQSRSLLQGL